MVAIERLLGYNIGYFLILTDIKPLKILNFRVAKCMEIMARSMEVQKYRHST